MPSQNDQIPEIADDKPCRLDMQTGDVQYLAYRVEKDKNPKGIVRYLVKKEYGSCGIYISETSMRPSPASGSYKSKVILQNSDLHIV